MRSRNQASSVQTEDTWQSAGFAASGLLARLAKARQAEQAATQPVEPAPFFDRPEFRAPALKVAA